MDKRVWAAFIVALGCSAEEPSEANVMAAIEGAPAAARSGERIAALGGFSCDFSVDFTRSTEPVGAEVERDRILSQRFVQEMTHPDSPGMLQKHIPLLPLDETTALGGGRYLFQGRWQAEEYRRFITEYFTYPGDTQFLDRPAFVDPECRDWTVLSAWRFAELETHTVVRTERFDTGRTTLAGEVVLALSLLARAQTLMGEAESRGLAEVQLLHNLRDHKVQVVYFGSRVLPPDPTQPDVAAFGALAAAPPLADGLADALALTRVFDQTEFVVQVWLPYAPGDSGPAALWPNSPPFPQPFCGDGVCVPSRGEDGGTCAPDCAVTCGDAVCQPGEDVTRCPSDCELPLSL